MRDAHADQAGALGLADGLPLGHVERVRERRDDLGLPYLSRSTVNESHAILSAARRILNPLPAGAR